MRRDDDTSVSLRSQRYAACAAAGRAAPPAPRAARSALAAAAILAAALFLASCPTGGETDPPVVGSWTQVDTGIRSYAFAKGGAASLTISTSGSTIVVPEDVFTLADWSALTPYAVGDYVLTNVGCAYFLCLGAGTSDAAEPAAPAAVGDSVPDGTVLWRYVDELQALGTWTLSGSALKIVWAAGTTEDFTVSFSGTRMRMQGYPTGAPFDLERS